MLKFQKCLSSFVSDEYANLNDLLSDSTTANTVDALKNIQSVQILIPKLVNNRPLKLADLSGVSSPASSQPRSCPALSHFLNGTYPKQDDSLKYLLIENTPIHFILHPHFLTHYLQQGELHIQTANVLSELDDCISLSSDGLLFICVQQTSYTRLGLVGELAHGYKKKFGFRKYIVELDLTNELIHQFDSKYYQRTFAALKNCGIKMDLLIKWRPYPGSGCSPLSVIRFFDLLKYQQLENDEFFDEKSFREIVVHQCGPNLRKFELDQFPMPVIDKPDDLSRNADGNADGNADRNVNENETSDEESFACSRLKTLIDSFGLALTGSYLPDEQDEDDEVNTFRLDRSKLANLICLEITGFFTANNVRTILSELFELIKLNGELEYAVLIVNGFENAIRSWSGQSNCHLKHLSGESLYGLCLSRHFSNFVWRVGDKTDFGIEKL